MKPMTRPSAPHSVLSSSSSEPIEEGSDAVFSSEPAALALTTGFISTRVTELAIAVLASSEKS